MEMFAISLLVAALVNCATAVDVAPQPGLEPGSKLPYLFSVPGNVVFGLVFLLLALIHLFLYTKSKARWTLVLPIAEIFSAIGYFLRILMRSKQHSVMLYSISTLFVVLSPAAFLAFNYMMFGRLVVSLDDSLTHSSKRTTPSRFSLVPPRIFGIAFVWSDVITFIIQAGGGAMQAAGGKTASTGNTLFLIGVTAQAVSYIIFIFLFTVSHYRLAQEGLTGAVKMLFIGLYIASICILIRSFFRIAEMAEGYNGKLFHSENFLFALDSLPLVLANSVWVLLWPPTLMQKDAISRQGLGKGLPLK